MKMDSHASRCLVCPIYTQKLNDVVAGLKAA